MVSIGDVDWSSTALYVVARPEDPSLPFVIVRNVNSRLCNINTGVISIVGFIIYSDESRYCISNTYDRIRPDEGVGSAIVMYASW